MNTLLLRRVEAEAVETLVLRLTFLVEVVEVLLMRCSRLPANGWEVPIRMVVLHRRVVRVLHVGLHLPVVQA